MKKRILVLIGLSLLSLVGCSRDDESIVNNINSLSYEEINNNDDASNSVEEISSTTISNSNQNDVTSSSISSDDDEGWTIVSYHHHSYEDNSSSSFSYSKPSINEDDYESSSINRTSSSENNGSKTSYEYIKNVPDNINNKVIIGNDNASMTTFKFDNEYPEYFKGIYGNNYYKGDWYATGALKFSGGTNAKKGFMTCAFTSNLKLEYRINITEMYPSTKSNKINKNNPVMTIKGYDDNGKEVASKDIENITYNSNGTTLKGYLNGENISYLQVMVLQLPYKSSQTYNFGISELSLIAWPYALK